MKKIFAVLFAVFAFVAIASANNYSVDEAAVDAIFSEAVMEASASSMSMAETSVSSVGGDPQITNVIALVVDWVGLGGIGIHRLILGTKPINCLWYFLTIGGIFGVVPLVDGILLIVDLVKGQANWLDNPAFIMWI